MNQTSTFKMEQKLKKTPIGEIPMDWELVKLGAVCSPGDQKFNPVGNDCIPYVGLEHINSSGKLIGTGNSSEVTSLKTRFRAGSILFGKLRPYLRKIVKVNFDGVCSTDIMVIQPAQGVSADYILYVLQSDMAVNHAVGTSGGTKMPRTSWPLFSKFMFPLPPTNEQRKIAEILSTVDDAIGRTDAVIEKARQLKNGLMQVLLTKGIGHKRYKQTKIGQIPESWDLRECEAVCDPISVGIVVQPARLYQSSGVPCLRSVNIHEDMISDDNLIFISKEANRINSKSQLHAGDVVIIRSGYPGTASVVSEKFEGANCVDLVFARPGKALLGKFLSRYINSTSGKNQVLQNQGGLAQQHINVGAVAKMMIPLPPVDEQTKICRILSEYDDRMRCEDECAIRLQALKQALMRVLLTGKVRRE